MILIICALKLEAKPFLNALQHRRVEKCDSLIVYHGEISGVNVIVTVCGVGVLKSANAVQSVIGKYDISQVIMSGTAGGIDRKLNIGDTVISEEILFHDDAGSLLSSDGFPNLNNAYQTNPIMLDKVKLALSEPPLTQHVYFGRITTGRKFVARKDFDLITERFHPLCADMESAAVAYISNLYDIPFVAVRSISDNGEKSGLKTFLKYARSASQNSFSVVSRLLNTL